MSGWVVVDASVAVKWLVDDVYTEAAVALAQFWSRSGIQPTVPYLMPVEVANALYRRILGDQLSARQVVRLLDELLDSGLEFREPAGLLTRAIDVAAQLRQGTVYDSYYLSLAEHLDCELWTADEKFYRAAEREFGFVKWLGDFTTGE